LFRVPERESLLRRHPIRLQQRMAWVRLQHGRAQLDALGGAAGDRHRHQRVTP